MRALVFALVLVPLVAVAAEHTPETIAGPAVALDGDTLQIGEVRVRLFGIDAPEMKTAPWGGFARAALDDLIAGREVACEVVDIDRYKRPVARCAAGGVDLSGAMIASGWAVAYRRFTTDYDADERAARAAGRGLWAALPVEYAHDNPGFWDVSSPIWPILIPATSTVAAVLFGVWLGVYLTRREARENRDRDAQSTARLLRAEIDTILRNAAMAQGLITRIMDERQPVTSYALRALHLGDGTIYRSVQDKLILLPGALAAAINTNYKVLAEFNRELEIEAASADQGLRAVGPDERMITVGDHLEHLQRLMTELTKLLDIYIEGNWPPPDEAGKGDA